MATKVKSTKMLKREVVIPFEGEENFVVPKKKGFGQPDMEGYVMATGSTTLGGTTNTPAPSPRTNTQVTTESGTTTSTSSPTQVGTSSTTIVTGASTPQVTIAEPELTPQVSTTPTTTSPRPLPNVTLETTTSQAQLDCEANGGIYSNGTCTMPPKNTTTTQPPISDLPTFPNWGALDCTTLSTEISKINSLMSTSKFTTEVVNIYNTQLASANAAYLKNCSEKPTPPPTPIIPVVPIGGGGGIFGGGGGGLGEEPMPETIPTEEPKSGYGSLLLILGVIGVAYYFLRK